MIDTSGFGWSGLRGESAAAKPCLGKAGSRSRFHDRLPEGLHRLHRHDDPPESVPWPFTLNRANYVYVLPGPLLPRAVGNKVML